MQDEALRSAVLERYTVPKPPLGWQQLCSAANTGGRQAVEDALGWRRLLVPDVEGASGEAISSLTGILMCPQMMRFAFDVNK